MGGTHTAHPLPARAGARGIRLRLALFALALLSLVAAGALLPSAAAAGIDDTIASALQSNGVSGSATGVYIWDLDAGRLVYEKNATTELAPASNMKLVTTAAALMEWDDDHRFETELWVPDVPISNGVISGDVYLRGLGDPSLSTLSYQHGELDMTTASFEAFARKLKREGVKKIRGRVLGDASWFDKQTTVSSWTSGLQLECGPLSGLTGNESLDDGNRVGAPATWAAKLLTKALVSAGIKVTGKPGSGKVLSSTRLIKTQYSAALPGIIKHMNKESDNFFAEMVLKGLGKDLYDEGSTAAGTEASAEALRVCGIEDDTYVVADGSGLSYSDRLTAYDVVKLLGAMRQRSDFDAYYDSLAIAGKDGTLRDRMRGTAAAGNAHAKTGTLNIAVCLSGYVESANEHRVAFSILVNGGSVDWGQATSAQDAIVVALANASLAGARQLAATPNMRQHAISAFEAVHVTGSGLQACVDP